MPFINIPESKFSGAIAVMVGKAQGLIEEKVRTTLTRSVSELLSKNGPTEQDIKRVESVRTNLTTQMNSISNKFEKLDRLPSNISRPIRGLEAAIKVILTLPVPQAVPPGVGLPISITTKYANTLQTVKETVRQLKDTSESISSILEIPKERIKFLFSKLPILDIVALLTRLIGTLDSIRRENKEVNNALKNAGLVDDSDQILISKLRPKLLELVNNENPNLDVNSELANILAPLDSTLREIENANYIDSTVKSRLQAILVNMPSAQNFNNQPIGDVVDQDLFYTARNGETYRLSIRLDPSSPKIAQKNIGEAIDANGVVVLKTQPSFASNPKVLLQEIKFRLDNQLP